MRTPPFSVLVLLICMSSILGSAVMAEPAPQLDGFLSDPVWAAQARSWTLSDPTQPGAVTRCYIAYDDQYLYFAADVYDLNVIGTNRTPKSRVWEDDSVRLLLHLDDPNATTWTNRTFSYTFGSQGGATWNRGPLPKTPDKNTEPGWPPAWDSAVTWAVGLKPGTTPNVTGDRDGGFVVEARIPWIELGVKPPFQPGSTVNICLLSLRRPEMNLPGGKPLSSVQAARELNPPNPSLWEPVRMDWQGPLPTRGLVEPLPLWLGSPDPEFDAYKSAETDPRGPWLDRSQWTARLDLMRSQNLNTLVLRHSNPLIGLLSGATSGHNVDSRPAALPGDAFARSGWFKTGEFERQRDQFRWILAEAAKNGINVYLLLDGSGVSQYPSACSQPSSQASTAPADSSTISRSIRQLFELYPALAGVAAGTGFNSPATLHAIANGMASRRPPSQPPTATATRKPASSSAPAGNESPRPLPVITSSEAGPELLIWTDGIDPTVARRVIDHYPKTKLLHPLQGGQWLQPLVNRKVAAFNARTAQLKQGSHIDPLPSIVVGSLRGAANYLFWADPQWMRNVLLDVRNQGIQGFLLDVGQGEHSLAREAMADYAYNASQQFSPQRWESRLRVFGVDQYAGQLLNAIQHASAIMPHALLLMNDSSGRFMPQFGLPLTHCLNMPSYTPTANGLGEDDGRGLLTVPLGPAWTNPCWGRSVAGIISEVARNSPSDAVPAWEIINEIEKHVQSCNAVMPPLRHLPPKSADQARALTALLDAIELNADVGNYLKLKLQAAVAWEQYKARRGRVIDFIDPLRRSVDAYRKVALIGDRLYPQPLYFWESQIVSPPPWTPQAIQRRYVPLRGRWESRVHPLEHELDIIQESTSSDGIAATLPLWDHLNAASPEKLQTRVVIDFEKPDQRYHLAAGASITTNPEQRITGKASLLIDTRKLPPGYHEVMTTDVGLVPLVSLLQYQVTISYRVIDPGAADNADATEPFEIGFRQSLETAAIGDHRCWTAPKGHLATRILQVHRPQQDGNIFYIATRKPSAIVIDHIQIAQVLE